MSSGYTLAIVGATGAVGKEMLRVLERRNFPVRSLRLLASARSVGKSLLFRGESIPVQELKSDSFQGIEFALFSAGGSISKQFAPIAARSGAIVIDNSSAFRMQPDVPLVVPEINGNDALHHHGIIANPNCTTAITLMALAPLHNLFGLHTIIASSYQAVSGTGARAIEELREQILAYTSGNQPTPRIYPYPIAFNVIPQVDSFLDNGYTREEMKMQNEGRKILHLPNLRASVTCVRVPVFRSHSIAVTAQFQSPPDLAQARQAIQNFPGVTLEDDPANNLYPTPLAATGDDKCRVGRLRLDCALENAISLWVVGDQLLKGAALNAVQILELLTKNSPTPN